MRLHFFDHVVQVGMYHHLLLVSSGGTVPYLPLIGAASAKVVGSLHSR
jgi:hypothetical protein